MKSFKLVLFLSCVAFVPSIFSVINPNEKKEVAPTEKKAICSFGELDSVFTEEYKNLDECRKLCEGDGAVCQLTDVATTTKDVD